MTKLYIPTFEQSRERIFNNPEDHRVVHFRLYWDSIGNPFGRDRKHFIIGYLSLAFPHLRDARELKPLGHFGKLGSMFGKSANPHKAIYDHWFDVMSEKHDSPLFNEPTSMGRAAYRMFKNNCRLMGEKFDGQDFMDGMGMMLYRTSWGITKEWNAIEELSNWEKLPEGFTVVRAAHEWESEDVDAHILNPNGDIAVNVSVKNGKGTFNPNLIRTFREEKRKTTPDMYIGFPSKGEEFRKLGFYYPASESRVLELMGA